MYHLNNLLQISLLKKFWISLQPPTELQLERARKHNRTALLLNPGGFILVLLIHLIVTRCKGLIITCKEH